MRDEMAGCVDTERSKILLEWDFGGQDCLYGIDGAL